MFCKEKVLRRTNITVACVFAWLIFVVSLCICSYSYAGETKISKESIELLTRIGQATAEVVDAVRPAVVNISTTRTVKLQGGVEPFFDDPFFRHFFGDRYKAPRERKSSGLGSGVIVDADGYILTANHVIQGADEIKVTLSDKREFKGKVVGSDAMTDVGVVKIEAKDLPSVKMGDSSKLRVGETVLAIGSPYGLNQTVTMGIVSAVGRANVGIADYEDFIQTDAAINPGNSGGALVNVRGELVGINTAIFSTSGGYQGIGFAVPTSMAKAAMDSLIKKGKVVRGWLGVSIQSLTPELAKQFQLKDEKGVLIGEVVEDSPAEKAGLQRGDIIVEVQGKKVEEPNQIRNMIAGVEPGHELELKILRDNKPMTKKVVVTELPSEMQKPAKGEYNNLLSGVSVQELTPEIAGRLNMPKNIKGVIVSEVDEESAAFDVIKPGDVIMEIDKLRVTGVKDYEKIVSKIKQGEDILLFVRRGQASRYITLSAK
ncbi:MAG TPA: DegQ family serine endoprotease [Thermodesulfovibrionales bacterium]|nr:DegQ family serine endoprotease [Thermodesulfovibrionales bacterium]